MMAEPWWFSIYGRAPVWVQNVACSLSGIRMRWERYGRVFRRALRFLEESQWWSYQEQRAYQDEKLADLVRHAYETVPYYREVFDERKLKPADIRTADDLPRLPLLTKEIVRGRADDLRSTTWPRRRTVLGHTAGTTGTALQFAKSTDVVAWHWVAAWRHRGRNRVSRFQLGTWRRSKRP